MHWMVRLLILATVGAMNLFPILSYGADSILTWNANTEPDLAGYKIYRAIQSCSAPGPLAPLMKGSPPAPVQVGKVTTYTDTGLPALDGTICWEITAFDTAGNESLTRSNRASKDLNTIPPAAPTGLNAVIQ